MHVNSFRDPIDIEWWENVPLVVGKFLGGYVLHVEGIHSLRIAQLIL